LVHDAPGRLGTHASRAKGVPPHRGGHVRHRAGRVRGRHGRGTFPRARAARDRMIPKTAPRPGLVYGVVFALALLIRFDYLLQVRGTPLAQVLVLDARTYDAFARRIIAGTFRGEDVYAMNALYPYLVAAVYRLAHGSYFAVFVVQALVDALTC